MFCSRCGHHNAEDSRFCANCGAALTRQGAAPRSQTDTTSTISLPLLENALEAGEAGSAGSAGSAGKAGSAGHGGAQDPADGHLEQPLAGTAMLVVRRGPNAGSRFLLDAEVTTAGRHPDSDIFLDDVTVSRRHAEFVRDGDGFLVRDVGSLNGTYLDRERIETAGLGGGDEVQIGKYRLVFLAGAGDAR